MKTKRFFRMIYCVLFPFLIFSFIACEEESEKKITEKEVPQAVLNAFTAQYPDATVNEYSEEIDDGKTYYEISFQSGDQKIDISYDPEGKMVVLEESIPADEMPIQIKKAITAKIPQYSLILFEKVQEKGRVLYEAKVLNTQNNKKYELLFTESGKLLGKEVMEEEEEEE
jgi:uncharacterized membrane protein YkoI